MADLSSLRPVKQHRLIDLVEEAGISVADWANYKGGRAMAGANPKYCYEWAFVQPSQFVILNVWYQNIELTGSTFVLKGNLRASATRHARGQQAASPLWQRRAERFDSAVSLAASEQLPVRAVICDGIMRRATEGRASIVKRRALDSVPWAVTRYDSKTGQFTLTRGALPHRLIDQFSVEIGQESPTETRSQTGHVFVRDPRVRRAVLRRAGGLCEWCGQPGFTTASGDVFLETHHVVPLAEGGADKALNVVALCPNHHREAHFGSAQTLMRQALLKVTRAAGNARRRYNER